MANIRRLAPKAQVFEVSAKSGDGMNAWVEFLVKEHQALKHLQPAV
jgi:hypothetical protein